MATTVALGRGWGTGATVSLDANARDTSGVISVTAGRAFLEADAQVTLTFSTAFRVIPYVYVNSFRGLASEWTFWYTPATDKVVLHLNRAPFPTLEYDFVYYCLAAA